MESASEKIVQKRCARRAAAVTIAFLLCLPALLTVWRRHFNPVEGQERSSLEVKSTSFPMEDSFPRSTLAKAPIFPRTCSGQPRPPGPGALRW